MWQWQTTHMQLVDETESDLRRLVERDFGLLAGGQLTNQHVLDWMHYRTRLIPCRPRAVVVSQEVALQMASYPAIGRLKAEFESGRDVSPWLSDRVRKRKEDPLADLMFNDWQISHFHLGNLFVAPNKIGPRSNGELLLFALVKADYVTFLDLHPHGAWSTTQILRVLLRTSPQDMPEAKGIIGTQSGGATDAELLKARKAGYTAPIHIDGRVFFPPGLGVSGSRHAARLVLQFNRLSREIRNLHRRFTANDLPHQLLRQLSVMAIPARLGVHLREDGCMVLFEKTRAIELLVMPPLE
jgi:hypothetical protein